jgi:DNA polymerase-1
LQNVPKRAAIDDVSAVRDLFIARPGMTLVACDYERAEVWLAAHYSRDERLSEAYYEDRDLYRELAARSFEIPLEHVSAEHRTSSKADFLSIQYGVGAAKIARKYGWKFTGLDELVRCFEKPVEAWDDPEWRQYFALNKSARLKRAFFDMVPGIKSKMKLCESLARGGTLRLWTGRILHFDGRRALPFAAWNGLLQGGVAEVLRLAMQRLEEPLRRLGAHMVLTVHDELVTESPTCAVREVVRLKRKIMTDFDFWLRPRVDVSVGQRYGRLSPYEEHKA